MLDDSLTSLIMKYCLRLSIEKKCNALSSVLIRYSMNMKDAIVLSGGSRGLTQTQLPSFPRRNRLWPKIWGLFSNTVSLRVKYVGLKTPATEPHGPPEAWPNMAAIYRPNFEVLSAATQAVRLYIVYGSVQQFQPTRLNAEWCIQFHDPHPRGKLPFTTASSMVGGLTRAYHFVGVMFVDKKRKINCKKPPYLHIGRSIDWMFMLLGCYSPG